MNVPVNTQLLAQYILELDRFFFRLAVVLGVLMVTIGGFQWLIALGNASKISNAKETIEQAVIGLILAFTSVLLLSQIDTSFVELKDLSLQDQLRTLEVTCTDYRSNSLCPLRVCAWVCSDPKEQAKPVKPANELPDPSKWRDPSCAGSCQGPGGSVGGDLTTCSNPYYGTGCQDSSALSIFLSCMNSEVSEFNVNLGQITTYQGSHKEYSCHFGGRLCKDGAHAVDFGNEQGYTEIMELAQRCIQQYPSQLSCFCEDANGLRYSNGGTPDCTNPAVDHIHCTVDSSACQCS